MTITDDEVLDNPEAGILIKTKTKEAFKRPSMWSVVLLNDDFTPMDFVVQILIQIFNKNRTEAERIMMTIHQEGKGIAGIYTHEIAEQKVVETMNTARNYGYPLRVKLEEV